MRLHVPNPLARFAYWQLRRIEMRNRREGTRAIGPLPPLRATTSAGVISDSAMHLERSGGRIDMLFNPNALPWSWSQFKGRATPFLCWFVAAGDTVRRITCDLSDGDYPGPERFTFSSNTDWRVPLPDMFFFNTRGFAELRPIADAAPDWAARGRTIHWRGLVNGQGTMSVDPAHMSAPWVVQRLRLAHHAKVVEGVDVGFVTRPGDRRHDLLADAGMVAPRRALSNWAGDRYAIDIDGFSNAWSNLLERMHLGCCVLKVDSQHGFRQWYYHRLVPFETHVPVRADLSDLAEQVEWVRSHDREAREIASNGQALARSLTFESETRAAARLVRDHWDAMT